MSLEAFLRSASSTSVTTPANAEFVEGECLSITSDGMYFKVPEWDGGRHSFGPAPWPKTALAEQPVAGVRVLVLFLGGGVGNPWVLSWWP